MQENFQRSTEKQKAKKLNSNYKINCCVMCSKGKREHNHPEDSLASRLFKIKPITCKHRLLKKQNKVNA